MNLRKFILIALCGGLFFGAIPVQQASSEKKNIYLENGVFIGGFDQGTLSLLNVRHSFQKQSKLERIVFDLAKDDGKPAERPGFFHVSVQRNLNRVVIDLENIGRTKVTAAQVTRLFQKAHYFSAARFYYDSRTRNLTVEMSTKNKPKVEVFELVTSGKPGRIVLDAKGS